ncbi:filamentous hemagglutinin N-terminal domain-containing protein [Candidatus Halobeggiatoa sp. HSG11]|nr:filamentous hemagglutinin N-terminal domain-containing protein [Candidatus Halobeggiatoa sp. HSG11]
MYKILLFIIHIYILTIGMYASAEVTLDGSLGNNNVLSGPNYLIRADFGQQHGNNLFHSFRYFNLNKHESAIFSGPNNIQNIISRVTGGNSSNIDGMIRSKIPNADMYFLNPNGIVFGPNAQLDVKGSFHASTAHYLSLGEQGQFNAINPDNTILTIAPVEAFGFFDSQVAPISIQGYGEVDQSWENKTTGLMVQEGKALSLIGGNIEIKNGTFFKSDSEFHNLPVLFAPYGQINLVSVDSQGEVKLDKNFVDVSLFDQLANIYIKEKSLLRTSGDGGGNVFIRSEKFIIDNSTIESKTLGNKNGGIVDIYSNNLTLDKPVINGGTISNGKSTNIYLQAKESINIIGGNRGKLEGNSYIYSRSGNSKNDVNLTNLGDSGKILLKAKNILLKDKLQISNRNYGGNGDDIIINGEQFFLQNGVIIDAYTYGNNGGDIKIYVDNKIEIENSKIIISSNTSKGNSGNILLETKDLLLTSGAKLSNSSKVSGNAGNIKITARGKITMIGTEKYGWRTTIISASNPKNKNFTGGKGGNISIETGQLLIKDGASIAVSSIAPEKMKSDDAGTINIDVKGKVEISGVNPYGEDEDGFGSGIYARSHGVNNNAGHAGKIILNANDLIIKDGGVIENNTNNNAKSGDIEININGITTIIGDSSHIQLKKQSSSQSAYLEEFDKGLIPTNYNQSTSGIYASSTSESDSSGASGSITLNTQKLVMDDKGTISTASSGGGEAGSIDIKVKDGIFLTNDAKITTDSKISGGGGMTINTGDLLYVDKDSEIATKVSKKDGDAGNMSFNSKFVLLDHNGKISATAYGGDGGEINIITTSVYDSIIRENKSNIDASSKKGTDGKITISSPDTDVSDKFMILPKEFVSADNELKSPCSSRLSENTSSFNLIASEGSANEVGDLLPSGLLLSKPKPVISLTNIKNVPKANMSGGCKPIRN